MKVNVNLNNLIPELAVYLKEEINLKPSTVHEYVKTWTRLKHYAENQKATVYTIEIGKMYLDSIMGNKYHKDLTAHEKRIFKGVKVLNEYIEKERLDFWPTPKHVFTGAIGDLMTQYIAYRESLRLSKNSISTEKMHLHRFLIFLEDRNIQSLVSVESVLFIEYCKVLGGIRKASSNVGLRTLKYFFNYLYNHGITASDYSGHIPKAKYINQTKLPTNYTSKEVEKLLLSIDRANKKGKRDYAIFLVAARLGLRSSDIRLLKFENIDWDNNLIKLEQQKTGGHVELPLLPDVGNAIIDYLQYSRPKSDSSYLFLEAIYPHNPLGESGLSRIFFSIFRESGINITNKRAGAHTLRHSLAVRMLEENTILPIISEVLGHSSTDSTKYYLRIDIQSLRQCVLDVPEVPLSFYEQKGGTFYA